MQNLKLTISGDSLTVESFKDVLSGAKEAIEGRLSELEEVKMSNLKVAILEYDANIEAGMSEAEAKKIYDQTVADIQEAYEKGVVEVSYGTVDFGLSTLKDAFAKELKEAEKNGWFSYEEKLELTLNDVTLVVDEIDMGEGPVYTGIQSMITNLSNQYAMEASKLSDEARKNLEELLKAMAPTMEDYENLAETSRKTGTTVIDGVREGINDYNELKALTGDVQSINYLIGQQFSTDPVFLNTLATVKDSGKYIDKSVAEGLLNNIDYVTASGTDVIVGVKNSVTGEVINITPELKENLSNLGVDMGNALGDEYDYIYNEAGTAIEGVKSSVDDSLTWINPALKSALEDAGIKVGDAFSGKYDYIYDETGTTIEAIKSSVDDTLLWVNPEVKAAAEGTGNDLVEGLKQGVDDEKPSLWDLLSDWVEDIIDKVKEFFGIASPSKEFKTIGGYLVDGLIEGFTDPSALLEPLEDMWDEAKKWWEDSDLKLAVVTTIEDIKTKLETKWEDARTWWNDKKLALKSYLPSISDIKTSLSSKWTAAKTWWEGKDRPGLKSFSVTIGDIKTKLSGLWSAAKTWWEGKDRPALKSYGVSITSIQAKLSSLWTSAKEWWEGKKRPALKTSTPPIGSIQAKFVDRWTKAKEWWEGKKRPKLLTSTPPIGSIAAKFKDRWAAAKTWWEGKNRPKIKTFTPGIGSIQKKLQDAWAAAKTWWKNNVKLSIPSMSFKVTYSTSGLGKVQKAVIKALGLSGWPKLSFAANGGIFDVGSLIWAGERGPEVVANAGGGKTGVMNVQQMSDAVFEGVYAAVIAANRASQGEGGGQAINVYLDGKQITAVVEKRQRERGTTIMGNQVYSYG